VLASSFVKRRVPGFGGFAGVVTALALALLAPACGSDDEGSSDAPLVSVTPAPAGSPWETLAEWHLFADPVKQTPAKDVAPYEVISSLYADEALKHRFMHVPAGKKIAYQATRTWGLPIGTILVKTFSYPEDARDPSKGERLLETRLLVQETDGWTAHTYVWDEAQTVATRKAEGDTIAASWIDEAGAARTHDYGVPKAEECQQCHGIGPAQNTLGGRTRQLDRDHDYGKGPENQIDHLAARGWFDAAPPPASERERLVDPFGSAPLDERARSYLDANCGHCHSTGGAATSSGLLLEWDDTASSNTTQWGVCKLPTSAAGASCEGTLDIVPGSPETSILICRIASREVGVQMPPLATKLADTRGVALLEEWIASLALPACP
jgi:uncharacterized repeat protein (TIGR03806 family)